MSRPRAAKAIGEEGANLLRSDCRTIAPSSSSTSEEDGGDVEPELDWSLGPSPSSLALPPAPSSAESSSATTLRQRTTTSGAHSPSDTLPTPPLTPHSSSNSSKPTGSSPPSAEPHSRPLSRSPLLQFSAFPPPALRSAEADFSKAATEMMAVVEAQRRVERLQRRVEEARRRGSAE